MDDLVEADSLAYSSAMKYTDWQNRWIDAGTLAREFGTDWKTMLSNRKGNWINQTDTTGITHMAYVAEMVSGGQVAPLEYTAGKIKDIILSSRKQALINGLERDLLNDARENGTFVIY